MSFKSSFLYLFALASSLSPKTDQSQPTNTMNGYQIEYDWTCEFYAGKGFESTLYSYSEGAFFSFKQIDKTTEVSENESIIIDDSYKHIRYDSNSDSIFQLGYLSSISPNKILIAEKSDKINWNLKDSTKMIMNNLCHFAVGEFRGRTYYAWYNPSIAINHGPWKLHGLPGAIIYARDSTNEISFEALSVDRISDEKLRSIIKKPNLPIVSRLYYRKKREELYDRLENIKPENGSNVTYDIKLKRSYFEYY